MAVTLDHSPCCHFNVLSVDLAGVGRNSYSLLPLKSSLWSEELTTLALFLSSFYHDFYTQYLPLQPTSIAANAPMTSSATPPLSTTIFVT